MNLVLLFKSDFIPGTTRVRLEGRRLTHVLEIHKAQPGDRLTVGLENGDIGQGTILSLDQKVLDMDVALETPPPPGLSLNLILALPRPKVLNRVLVAASSLGVKHLWLINAMRVEKSYWQSPRLAPENLLHQSVLGLEQAKDTRIPDLILRKGFKPFVEDELPGIVYGTRSYVAHPGTTIPCPCGVQDPVSLAIGPEGGFIPYEIKKLEDCGFIPVHLGDRILRVESVIPYIIGKLFG